MPRKKEAAAPVAPPKKKKKPEVVRTVPLSHYREAVQQHFDCAPSDFEFAVCWENGPCQVKMGNKVYRVDSTHDITEHAKWLLTDRDGAMEFPREWALMVLEGVHREKDFYFYLLQDIATDALKLAQLQTVLAVTQITGNDIEAFWENLYAVDCIELYPAAILAASKTYDLACMVEDVVIYLTGEGDEHLNQLQDGIFETVVLNEVTSDDPSAGQLEKEEYFYIYSVDDCCWDEKEVVQF